jgi:hypothetical protein
MAIRIKLKGYDIVVLPEEGKVLGRLRKDGTRKEILTCRDKKGYHRGASPTHYPESSRARIVWYAVNGPIPKGMQINHKNHDRADDRLSNLELVSSKENARYRRKPRTNSSGYKGVRKVVYKNKISYRALIVVDNKFISIGCFSSPEEAALAYNNAALLHFGQYAILNHIGSAR